MVVDQARGSVGERIARLEAMFDQIITSQDKIIRQVDELSSEQEQRVARAAIGKGVFEITKLIIAAFSGAMATLIISRGH